MTTDRPAHIVTYVHRPNRAPRRKAQAAAIVGPRIVVTRKLGPRLRPEPESDPEADARVRAFLRKMMPNHPLLQDD